MVSVSLFSWLRNLRLRRRAARKTVQAFCFALLAVAAQGRNAAAQEPPYLVTYSDVLEEPGSLEVATQQVYAAPKDANPFFAQTWEVEYGVTAWWTTELYLQGQSTVHDSTVMTGIRFENRFRPLRGSHLINPVLYVEFEDVNRADKSFLELTGNEVITDQQVANGTLRRDRERSIEGKLILSSYTRGFNLSENFIAEKHLSNEPWEFGYAAAVSHPLRNEASTEPCRLCRQNFSAGAEIFGGLGTRYHFGTGGTSIYAGPTLSYSGFRNISLLAGPQIGLNANSADVLWRWKAAYEFNQLRDLFRSSR